MTMQKALHPGDDVDRQYASRKRRRGLASIDRSVEESLQVYKNETQLSGQVTLQSPIKMFFFLFFFFLLRAYQHSWFI